MQVLKIVLREENLALLMKNFDDFSVMGILLKVVCIEANLIGGLPDGLFLSERKKLLYRIMDKFLTVNASNSATGSTTQETEIDLSVNECIQMNGAAFFRYLIKDMNVIDLGITSLVKEPADFFEKILTPLFEVLLSY